MPNEASIQVNKLKVGNYVALCDTDEPDDVHLHLCKVLAIEDERAILLNHGTNLKRAVFKVWYQEEKTSKYTLNKPRNAKRQEEVADELELDVADDYIDHYDIKITNEQKIRIKAKSIRRLGLKHHLPIVKSSNPNIHTT